LCERSIAAGIVNFHFLSGGDNSADILSKHWGNTQIKERLKALLFWKGDTAAIKEWGATFQANAECQVLVHSRVEYQAFPKRHSTAINRNSKHA
jgi:hypothetical protein